MPRCIAPGCTSGYDSNKEKVHFFYVPNDKETIKLWQAALRRKDFIVKAKQPVCEKHFLKSDILWHRTIYDKNGHILGVSAPFKIPRLKKNTIPTQFPWTEETEEIKINVQNVQKEEVATEEIVLNNEILKEERKNLELSLDDIINIINTKQFYMPPQWTYLKHFNNNIKLLIFYVPMVNANSENKYSVYSQKEVVLKENMELEVNILKQSVAAFPFDIQIHNTIKSIEQLRETLYSINNFNVCLGANNITNEIEEIGYHLTYKDISGIWRHNKCPLILSHLEKKCKFCSNVKKSVQRKIRRTKIIKSMKKIRVSTNTQNEKKILLLRNKYYKAEKARKRSKYVANKLKEDLTNCKIKAEEISMKTIEDRLRDKKIPDNQLHVMREIIQATKCTNLKSRRYSEEWILLCMLMRMKSPTAYNFLRDNQILPLPCIRTIQRYLSLIDTPCGFDTKFFDMFKKVLDKKEDKQKHGIILLDEIHLRENILVNSKKLNYTGLVDFGNDGPQSSNLDEKANYGLVIMFHPIADSYSQPIAVFASRGPVSGEMLAQLIIKAISLLENIGAKVHGVITDGAATNRKFWTTVGVSGAKDKLKNYFEHPTINGRYVFVFSDWIHLLKTLRNRLYSTPLLLSPEENLIKWDYFQILHNKDKTLPAEMRVCPRITTNHLELNNTAKMRVSLAVQVFSKSMAHGLRFYKNFLPELRDCDNTANFCDWINDLFDALNQKQGVKIGDNYYKTIEESLKKLDSWEEYLQNGAISKDNFLTRQTAEGLRVTLKSTIDLIQYLTLNAGFDYVPTGRLNQDSLERFFGTVRHVAGSDNHPGTPTFLQIYKILSTFSIIKPPKYGNCTVSDTNKCEPTISISEIKSLYYNSCQKESSIEKLKLKLDNAIKNNEYDENFDHQFMGHDYSKPEIIDCVIYYVTGYLSNHILKSIKCDICKNAFINSAYCPFPTAVLTDMKTEGQEGRIIHPNLKLYYLIKHLENLFIKYCNRSDVFDLIIEDIYTPALSFPCKTHGDKILSHIIEFYIIMRMRQHTNKKNQEKKKINRQVKKTANFYES